MPFTFSWASRLSFFQLPPVVKHFAMYSPSTLALLYRALLSIRIWSDVNFLVIRHSPPLIMISWPCSNPQPCPPFFCSSLGLIVPTRFIYEGDTPTFGLDPRTQDFLCILHYSPLSGFTSFGFTHPLSFVWGLRTLHLSFGTIYPHFAVHQLNRVCHLSFYSRLTLVFLIWVYAPAILRGFTHLHLSLGTMYP
jgi:hypothetical protein